MDYRLLLDWIDMPGDHFSIDQELEFSTDILADPAKTHLSLGNIAVSSACCASDPRIGQWLVEERFLDRLFHQNRRETNLNPPWLDMERS